MALTKGSQTTLDEWALTANAAERLGAELDVSTAYSCTLYIKAALAEAVASTGQPKIIIETTGKTSPASEDWTPFLFITGPSGTPIVLALNDTEPVGETVIACTNPVTANMDNNGKYKFIKNTTAANCEIIYQVSNSGDAGDTITILPGLSNEQTAAASIIVDIDSPTQEAVLQRSYDINCTSISRIRIRYSGNSDPDGPDFYSYSAYTLNIGL